MKNKIYYITRSYAPYQKGGGPLMRTGAVKYLQELGWDVTIVLPNYNSKDLIIEDNIIQIPFKGKHIQKLASLFERIGIYEDYLDKWVENAFEYLKDKIKNNDIVFATSGGELGTIKLGSLLKNKINCKFVANFRDPLNYSLVNGLKVDNRFHVCVERLEKKYLENSDLIITSTVAYKDSLINKYSNFRKKIYTNYFGYINPIDKKYEKIKSNKLRIAYSGSMLSNVQAPEILYEAYNNLAIQDDIELYFIGNYKVNNTLKNINHINIKFIDFLPHNEYLKFMIENIDVGFVSLAKDYYGACIPSKLYEYINLEIPILGALPKGDAMNIINKNNYGLSNYFNNIDDISESILKFKNVKTINNIKHSLEKDKIKWSMKKRIIEIDKILRDLN